VRWLREFIERIVRAAVAWIERCIPPYEPAGWNDGSSIQFNNNCYNYACDIRTNTFAQPGRATGNQYQSIDCPQVGAGAVSDGLVQVDSDKGCGCSECRHRVALVIWPGEDFHWYRLDRSGRWSHKPGGTEATDLDNSGNPITDPRTADRGPYTVFCGFYCVKKSAVTIN
jgi:hypothetical protein